VFNTIGASSRGRARRSVALGSISLSNGGQEDRQPLERWLAGDPMLGCAACMVNGYAAQVLRLDLAGHVLAAIGKSGKDAGESGEAHVNVVSPRDEIVVAGSVNGALVKFVRRP
jgi:hypothetical protein